ACHFYFKLNGAILVEIPEVAILVVANGGDERNDQTARTTHLCLIRAPIYMLPKDAIIFFVHTDDIGQFYQIAAAVSHEGSKIVNVAQAIASDFEGISQRPHAIFSYIEGVLAVVGWAGVAVGNDHLYQ